MQSNKELKICGEIGSNLPIVVGDCPHCGLGDRSLILIDFVPNGHQPEHSTIYFRCIGCSTITQKKVIEVAKDN
jgi:hypothetical protein